MDLARIRTEIAKARTVFSYVESHPTSAGSVDVLSALQTTAGRLYTLRVEFPSIYPHTAPSVYVRKPALNASVPHTFGAGRICYIHPNLWNPGRHDLTFVLTRAAKWLNKYEVWLVTRTWPGAEMDH